MFLIFRLVVEDVYAEKLKQLLQQQTEATLATTAVAQQLGQLRGETRDATLVQTLNQLQTAVEKLQRKEDTTSTTPFFRSSSQQTSLEAPTSEKSTSRSSSKGKSDNSEKSSKVSREHRKDQSSSHQHSSDKVRPGVDQSSQSISRTISSAIIIEASNIASRTSSSVKEVISQHQTQGESIAQTISEALASISETDQKSKSNITAEVEEELSTDYSSHFEEESTLKEKSFRAVLPSETHRRRSEKLKKKKEYSSDASESSYTSDKDKGRVETASSTGSLFSDTDSFTKFTLEMVHQYMVEEKSRDKHKEAILRLKEKALVDKANSDIEALDRLKVRMVQKGQDDKMPKIKKKQRSILLKLKEQQKEISRMREILKVAESERKFLIKQQKSMLKSGSRPLVDLDDSSVLDTTVEDTVDLGEGGSKGAVIQKKEVLQSLRKLEKTEKHLTSKEKRLLNRSVKGELRSDRESNDHSEVDDSVKTDISTLKTFKPNTDTTQSLIQHSRLHNSSAESDVEIHTASFHDTTSDQSDIEARITALNDQLQLRIKTAAKLKKEQRRDKREKLRSQEQMLIKQIEVYDKLINDGKTEITLDKFDSNEKFTRPKIKSPKSSLSERVPVRVESQDSKESRSESPASRVDNQIFRDSRSESSTSKFTSESIESRIMAEESSEEPTISKSSKITEHTKDNEDLSKDSDSSHKSGLSTSTVLASPIKGVSPDLGRSSLEFISREISPEAAVGEQDKDSVNTVSEVLEEALESLSNLVQSQDLSGAIVNDLEALTKTQELEPVQTLKEDEDDTEYSESFEITSKDEEQLSTKDETKASPLVINTPESVEESLPTLIQSEINETSEKEEKGEESIPAPVDQKLLEQQVDVITNQLWKELCKDTSHQVSPLIKHSEIKQPVQDEKKAAELVKPSMSSSVHSRIRSPISPRSKPQDLMLTTFDISPASSVSSPSDDKSDYDDKFDNDDIAPNDDDFMDDDFGLSAIRKEAEALRLQQQRVEEEIAKIQSQSEVVRSIPDKPPPPYVPPEPPAPVKPVRPPPPRTFIPQAHLDIVSIIENDVTRVFAIKKTSSDIPDLEYDPTIVKKPESLTEAEVGSLNQFHRMIHDLVMEKVREVFKNENLEQNPPWMPPIPVQKLKFLVPKTKELLLEKVKKQVIMFFFSVLRRYY